MRHTLTFLLLFFSTSCFSQTNDTLKTHPSNTFVSFITKLDIEHATKDGIYLNGYVVNIDYDQAKKLNGKKIRVSGEVTIVKGLKNLTSSQPIQQGREEDTKHIESPKIEIIKKVK